MSNGECGITCGYSRTVAKTTRKEFSTTSCHLAIEASSSSIVAK
jgi:hypothetical protein